MTLTDLDGRFRIEAVRPGRYYAFATLDGYLDPALGIDPAKLKSLSTGVEQHRYSIEQWKDHLTEVTAIPRPRLRHLHADRARRRDHRNRNLR